MAGYSGRSLAQKLGVKAGMVLCVEGAPDGFEIEGLPAGVRLGSSWEGFALVFLRSLGDLENVARRARELRNDGVLWVAWAKKSSRLAGELTFDVVQPRILETGLVDVKVCAIDEDWSGLKFVVRKELRSSW